jgi:thiol-disulfide isomerase/thioredoxin
MKGYLVQLSARFGGQFHFPQRRSTKESILMYKRFLALSVMGAMLLFGCSESSKLSDPPAADFVLKDLNGNSVALSDYRGKVVLLEFWATWCPPCRATMPAIEKIYKAYKDKGLVVLAISLDNGDWDFVKSFAASYGVTYTILKGTDDIQTKYGVRAIPTTVILDKNGRIAKRYLGFGNEDDFEKDIKAIL